jgi:hypothetical protein
MIDTETGAVWVEWNLAEGDKYSDLVDDFASRMPWLKYLETHKLDRTDMISDATDYISCWQICYIMSFEDAAMYALLYGQQS